MTGRQPGGADPTTHEVGVRPSTTDLTTIPDASDAYCRTCRVIAGPLRPEEASAWVWGHDSAVQAARPAAPAQPPAELPGPEQVEMEAQQYASDAAGYDVSVRDAWRDGYTAAEERWNAAANESARLDVIDNARLRAELADCRAAAEPDEDAPSVVDDQRKSREDVIGEREALRRAWRQEQTRRKAVAAELEQLRTWRGLMSLLDEHWPADIFQADPADETADPGPRIVALLRWLADCRAAGDALADAAANLIVECARRTVAHQAVHTRDLTGWTPLEREVKAWRSGR